MRLSIEKILKAAREPSWAIKRIKEKALGAIMGGFKVRKKNNVLQYRSYYQWETRNDATYELIQKTVSRFDIPDFDWIWVYTGDHGVEGNRNRPSLGFATNSQNFANVCPDFSFNHWRQTGMNDYTLTCEEIEKLGLSTPETENMGWRGTLNSHPNRHLLMSFKDKPGFDVLPICWEPVEGTDRLKSINFLSFQDQVKKWRYFIDVEGTGYSARTKLLFFSHRVVFLQDRPWKEWFYPYLTPWVHYVPIARDLSDLEVQIKKIRSDLKLEKEIQENALKFAHQYLTQEAALTRWRDLLTGFSKKRQI